MTAPKISLGQQIEAVRFAETRQRHLATGGSVRAQRAERVEQYDVERLGAAARTLEWLKQHEDEIRKLLAMEPERRAHLWNHMGEVAKLLDSKATKPAGEEGQP
jgi:hypothetical protein